MPISILMKLIDNFKAYMLLNDHSTAKFKCTVSDVVTYQGKKNNIAKSALRTLIPTSPVTGKLYMLPEIFKENNSGRELVCGIGVVAKKL